jgi:hypothetical protein
MWVDTNVGTVGKSRVHAQYYTIHVVTFINLKYDE